MRWHEAGAVIWLGLLAAAPALAQAEAPADSPRCQQQCGAVLPRRIDNPREVQSCLIRCQALERLQPPAGTASRAPAPGPAKPQMRREAPSSAPAPAPAPVLEGGPFGAVYLAPAPSSSMGLAANMPDRNAAHRAAELECIGRQGTACRLALEFHERCVAVAQGLVPRGLVLTEDPSTYQVMIAMAGSGAATALAEREAMAACRQRFRGTCRVARSICG